MGYTQDLISHWDMSDVNPQDIGWRNLGNHGVGSGLVAATDIVAGIAGGKATEFNGTDEFIDHGNDVSLDMTTKLTVMLWAKQAAILGAKALIAKWDFQTQGCWALQTHGANPDELQLYVAAALDSAGGENIVTTAANLLAGEWNHICFVYDGDLAAALRAKIYINGEQAVAAGGFIPATLTIASSSVKIGRFGGGLTRYYNGVIDEVMIFSSALTQIQVADLHNRTRQGRF